MTRTLDPYKYLQRLTGLGIRMDLGAVRGAFAALGNPAGSYPSVLVGGTNGKGSTVAFIEAIARAHGWKVGAYTSPHLLRYNERVRIDGVDAEDEALVAGFAAVEAARGDTLLTYFEYGTLCALWLFARASLDLVVLEVGLGGRLDAVNIVDADVAVITTVAITATSASTMFTASSRPPRPTSSTTRPSDARANSHSAHRVPHSR